MAFFSSDKENGGKGIEGLRPENLFAAAEKAQPGIVAKYADAVAEHVKRTAEDAADKEANRKV